jgi:uncharacterized protein YggE
MSKLNSCLPVLAATVLAAVALALPAAYASASSLPDYPFVHVSGSTSRIELPDIATLDFEMVALDADPAAARAVLEARVGEVRDLMQQLGIDVEDMAVREVRQTVRKEQQSPAGGPQTSAPIYELRGDVHINVRNVANWQKLAGGLFGKPNLDSFSAAFDLSTMDKVNDEMVTEAILDARRRAEVMAAAAGRRLGPVTAATPEALAKLGTAMGLEREEFRMPRKASNAGAGNMDREQLMMVQTLKLRQSVDVIFRLENALPAKARVPKRP